MKRRNEQKNGEKKEEKNRDQVKKEIVHFPFFLFLSFPPLFLLIYLLSLSSLFSFLFSLYPAFSLLLFLFFCSLLFHILLCLSFLFFPGVCKNINENLYPRVFKNLASRYGMYSPTPTQRFLSRLFEPTR